MHARGRYSIRGKHVVLKSMLQSTDQVFLNRAHHSAILGGARVKPDSDCLFTAFMLQPFSHCGAPGEGGRSVSLHCYAV